MRDGELPPRFPDQVCGPLNLLLDAYLGLSLVEDSGRYTKFVIHLHPVTKLRTCEAATPLSLMA